MTSVLDLTASVPAALPGRLPVMTADGADTPPAWAAAHRGAVRAAVDEHGAVVVRGLRPRTPEAVAEIAAAFGIEAMPEREAFAPRRTLAPGVLSSSEWPPDEPMCMHHELSYAAQVPSLALFACLTAPGDGGATAVADSTAVLRALPPELVERFDRVGWRLTRTYREVGVAWTEAFGTDDPGQVDAYCAQEGIAHEWLPDGALRTRQRRAAVVTHPGSGRPVWFNQAAFLNELTLDPMVREYLTDVYGPDSLPFNTAYGDGEPIPAEAVDTINRAYQDATCREPWRTGDVLLVDNLRMAHSREPYEGDREIAVVLGNPVRLPGHVLAP
ncbi:TauD/TfdA family dioxygenase [Streptomyces sp. XD-27]|uniref:TauD/TfdA family dioxygenase n=1 Tax=Streptomyces sp. XD-27 TaxID=3062779 RepID=UPI0026F42393|nr:TauD/TfdA family dioxygenase [Streptomyces sp. XD-27]WKX69501.1 TauD/TfdA family dioxygenase [Streptomyces sp. XD-27]